MHPVLAPCLAGALAGSLAAQMAGSYTVNPAQPASATNFPTLLAAVQSLASAGVAGPVDIDVYDDAGPYNESRPFVSTSGSYAPNTAVLVLGQWTGVSATNRVTFRAGPGESPVFDATGRSMGVFWGGADYVTLEGIEILNAIHDAISLYSEASHGQAIDAIIRGCRLHDCGGGGVVIYGNTPNPLNTTVENCFLWRLQLTNAGSFNTTGRFGYVTTRRSQGARIVHNTFYLDGGAGSMFCAIGSYPSSVSEIPYAEVSNNVIVKVAVPAQPVFRYQAASATSPLAPTVQDSNCVFDPSGGAFALYGSPLVPAATLLDWQLAVQRDLASLALDPVLQGAPAGELHLGAGSPCIGASSVAAGVAFDIDGQPRAGAADLGADQYSSATVATVGVGCAGSGGLVPELYTQQWPFLGNPRFAILTRALPPGALVLSFASLGLAPSPLPIGAGCTVYLDPATFSGLPSAVFAGPVGTAGVLIPIPPNPRLVGQAFDLQQMAIDAGAPLGITLTNGLALVLGS